MQKATRKSDGERFERAKRHFFSFFTYDRFLFSFFFISDGKGDDYTEIWVVQKSTKTKRFSIDLPLNACRCDDDELWKRVHHEEIRSKLPASRVPILENQNVKHVEATA